MSQLTKAKQQEWAKLLFIKDNLSQKEIAAKVGVSENTVGSWKLKGNWEDLKAINTISKPEIIRSWYAQINAINKAIAEREEGNNYATSKESDTLVKLAEAISKLESELGIAQITDVCTSIIDWLRPQSLEKAKELAEIFNGYIQTKL